MRSDRFRDLKDFWLSNKKLVVAVIVAMMGVLAMQGYVGAAKSECLGIADSRETVISFESPVVVKRIFVLPGQAVRKGQALLEVEPADLNMKLLEVQTKLEALKAEAKVRDQLLSSFGKGAVAPGNPIAMEIAGLQSQVDELRRQQSNAVRYAEEDGVVATVAARPREQIHPFVPVITLTSSVPNLVYGFVHEARLHEFRLGDQVLVEPVNDQGRRAVGQVVSIGNRIAPFPERFQLVGTPRPTYFGREVVISLQADNQILIGEKVTVRAHRQLNFSDLGFQAFAADPQKQGEKLKQVLLAEGLDLEVGGAVILPERDALLLVADDDGPLGSPFWLMDLKHPSTPRNLKMSGLSRIADVESVSAANGFFYAMSSLSPSKKGKIKLERNLIVRFRLDGDQVLVDRSIDLRTPMQQALARQPLLRAIAGQLDFAEIEGFTMDGADAFVALKEPQMPDGSAIILKVRGFANQVEAGRAGALDMEVFAMAKLQGPNCESPGRVTDLVRAKEGLLMLVNCRKAEQAGQIWLLREQAGQQVPALLTTLSGARPEGLAVAPDGKTAYVSSDNGNKRGSDILKLEIPMVP